MEPDGSWVIDYTDHNIGDNSIKSKLSCRQTSNISTIRVGGPRTVYWSWKLADNGRSSSSLELLDNGKPTGFMISEKDAGYWLNCTYDIKDASSHELNWIHINNWGESTARIDGICITPAIILFKNADVTPFEETLASENVYIRGFYEPPKSVYKLEVETQLPSLDVTLFTVLPKNKKSSYIIKTINTNNKILEWDDIKLFGDELGTGMFWFEARFDKNNFSSLELNSISSLFDPRAYNTLKNSNSNPIRSGIFIGPNISHVFLQADFRGDRFNREFWTIIKGFTSTTVGLINSDDGISWWLANGTILGSYTSIGEVQELSFSLPRDDPTKKFYEFAINGVRN